MDDTLERLCKMNGDVREKSSQELGLLSVGGTADKVPSLKQLLRLTAGKVPLVLELKGRKGDDEGFAESVLRSAGRLRRQSRADELRRSGC